MENPSLTPELRTEILAEYNALRTEMLHRIDMRQTLLTFTLVGAGSLLTIGLQNPAILLIYPILAMFLELVWVQHDIRIGQIGEYIRQNIEGRLTGLAWDSHLREQYKGSRAPRLVEIYAYGLFTVIPVLAVLLALPSLKFSPVTFVLLGADLAAEVVALVVLRRRRLIYRRDPQGSMDFERKKSNPEIQS
jgi:hypothetical protein